MSPTDEIDIGPIPDAHGAADLQRIFLFRGLDYDEVTLLSTVVEEKAYESGQIILDEGEIGNALYIIRKGEAEVGTQVDGKPVVFAHLGPWDFFGEMSLVTAELTSARITARTPVRAYRIPQTALEAAVATNPALGMKIYRAYSRVLAERLQAANDERVAALLATRA